MDDLVKLYSAKSGPEAVIIMSILDGADIRYMLEPNNPVLNRKLWGYITSYDTSMRPIEFYVHKDDCEQARQLLDAKRHDPDG